MEKRPDSSLIIGVATSTAERVQLVRLLGGADSLLLVSSAEQAAYSSSSRVPRRLRRSCFQRRR
jgi:hypothetical protein